MRTWIALLVQEDIGLMDALLLRQDADEYARALPLSAMAVLCVDHPELRPRIEDHALNLLRQVNHDTAEDTDPNLIGVNAHFVSLALDGRLPRLMEALEPLHKADLVDTSLNGAWKSVRKEFQSMVPPEDFHLPTTIQEMYDHLLRYGDLGVRAGVARLKHVGGTGEGGDDSYGILTQSSSHIHPLLRQLQRSRTQTLESRPRYQNCAQTSRKA